MDAGVSKKNIIKNSSSHLSREQLLRKPCELDWQSGSVPHGGGVESKGTDQDCVRTLPAAAGNRGIAGSVANLCGDHKHEMSGLT